MLSISFFLLVTCTFLCNCCNIGLQPSLQPCLLQPTPPVQPSAGLSHQTVGPSVNNNHPKPTPRLGATWSDGASIIDVDNLLSPRSPKAGPAPSINQLKSNPASPAHRPAWPNNNNNSIITTDDLLQ
ncbi:unnamed protein product [Danaus chrysippus]|uniref:(African queen) hypothetical protein n=1 Tax=Danaus chrysippus TaxID=151541 RepID=A0A8J2QR74_9NEOP|nr:unnamed protein product [Danaus chrysippus]